MQALHYDLAQIQLPEYTIELIFRVATFPMFKKDEMDKLVSNVLGIDASLRSRGQCYKSFHARNLRVGLLSYSVCHGRPCLLPYPQTLDTTERPVREKQSGPFVNYDRESSYNIGPRSSATWSMKRSAPTSRGQCYKTFFVRD